MLKNILHNMKKYITHQEQRGIVLKIMNKKMFVSFDPTTLLSNLNYMKLDERC